MTAAFFNHDEAMRQLNAWAVNPLKILRAEAAGFVTIGGTAQHCPMVLVDDRPDIRALIRSHLQNDGDAVFGWKGAMSPILPSFAVLKCEFQSPVKQTLSLKFNLRQHRGFLESVASGGRMGLAAGTPEQGTFVLAGVNVGLNGMLDAFVEGELAYKLLYGQRRHG